MSSYCVSFSVLVDGIWLLANKRVTYLLTYLRFLYHNPTVVSLHICIIVIIIDVTERYVQRGAGR